MTTWTSLSVGSATWSEQGTHPYALMTEDGAYYLFTEDMRQYIGTRDDDGAIWTAVSGGSATWSAT